MIIIFTFILSLVLVFPKCNGYERYKVIELNLKNDNEMNEVYQLSQVFQVDIWKGPSKVFPTHIMLSPSTFQPFVKELNMHNLRYKVINENVQKTIDSQYNSDDGLILKTLVRNGRSSAISNYFLTFEEIEDWLNKISFSNNFTSVGTIGKSFEGRNIYFIKVSTGVNRKSILMDGGIHAREWLSIATVNYIIEKIITNYNSGDKSILNLLSKYDFYFIPVLNPDGYVYSHLPGKRLWRKNRRPNGLSCSGVDLNRNFDVDFEGEHYTKFSCSEIYHGKYPFSEPETAAFANFTQNLKTSLHMYISLHSYGQFWFVPYAYTKNVPKDDSEMRRTAKVAVNALFKVNGATYAIGTTSELRYSATGTSYDWMKLKIGVKYSYTIELRPKHGNLESFQGFIAPESEIKYSGEEIYEGLIAAAKAQKCLNHELTKAIFLIEFLIFFVKSNDLI